jgi:hypothetical protein
VEKAVAEMLAELLAEQMLGKQIETISVKMVQWPATFYGSLST